LNEWSACVECVEIKEMVVTAAPLMLALKCIGPGGCRLEKLMGDCRASLIESQ
jgi:hypothetical protein